MIRRASRLGTECQRVEEYQTNYLDLSRQDKFPRNKSQDKLTVFDKGEAERQTDVFTRAVGMDSAGTPCQDYMQVMIFLESPTSI